MMDKNQDLNKEERLEEEYEKFLDQDLDQLEEEPEKEPEFIDGHRLFGKKERYPSFLYAGFAIRGLALIIDLIIISSLRKIGLNPILKLLGFGFESNFLSVYQISSLLLGLLYFTLMTKLSNGQTLGKMILGLRVVPIYEEELSWPTVISREFFGRIILQKIKILYGLALFSKKNQQAADFFAGTTVVKEKFLEEYLDIVETNV